MDEHIDESSRKPWVPTVLLVGALYGLVGIVFAVPGHHVRLWRLAAWGVSAAAWAAHVAYEQFALRNSRRSGALHVALAVALGALLLAVAANVHSLPAASTAQRRLLLSALVIWPLLTALPAFLAALAASWVLARLPRRARPR